MPVNQLIRKFTGERRATRFHCSPNIRCVTRVIFFILPQAVSHQNCYLPISVGPDCLTEPVNFLSGRKLESK